ncbi:hypothetical protein TRAPUB_7681 [Trametes pubescens]|uniref:Ribonuclease H1 N-terminal domain-containing protein n=1 Tax=Trametes pubescens TaxID=154538 RepID=A0A1M2V2M8_TRAPU|nr:hypothetical protein TRAPUB_7681 [Trametes pubescens]
MCAADAEPLPAVNEEYFHSPSTVSRAVTPEPRVMPSQYWDELDEEARQYGKFDRACRHRFFDAKVHIASFEVERPLYVVFRGAGTGPGVYSTWEELTDVVLGYHGALYQRCAGWAEACSRMMQALAVGGIVSTLPSAARRAPDMATWLSALKKHPCHSLHFSPGLLPVPRTTTSPTPSPKNQWWKFDLGRKSALDYEEVPIRALAPQPCRLTPGAASSRRGSRPPSPALGVAMHVAQVPSLSAVGGLHSGASVRGTGRSPSRPRRVGEGGYHTVLSGRTPWIYTQELGRSAVRAMTISCPTYFFWYADFAEALDCFRKAVRQGTIVPTWEAPE